MYYLKIINNFWEIYESIQKQINWKFKTDIKILVGEVVFMSHWSTRSKTPSTTNTFYVIYEFLDKWVHSKDLARITKLPVFLNSSACPKLSKTTKMA